MADDAFAADDELVDAELAHPATASTPKAAARTERCLPRLNRACLMTPADLPMIVVAIITASPLISVFRAAWRQSLLE
jgi:hypothetical protein